ncbi:hypothetical protein BD408DRAFT_446593 [Parasitella parasitica]|nr:hypothetical protein BD408DRAFT_446593 [Parasitella parasitica]
MSLPYDLVITEFRHYDYESNLNQKNDMSTASPPSYSAALAEKYQQHCRTTVWNKKLDEINHLLQSLRRSMQDAQFMLTSYQISCQRLELKNQTLLLRLRNQPSSASEIDTTTSFDFIVNQSEYTHQSHTNDSLNRMNQSLQNLILEAELSLNASSPTSDKHADHESFTTCSLRKSESCPTLDNIQLQQKKRYLFSQWSLVITMRQLIDTVQTTSKEKKLESENIETHNTAIQHQHHHHIHHQHHHHHYHHHHYHHDYPEMTEAIARSPLSPDTASLPPSQKMLRSVPSLTSLFKYAIDTIGGFIPQLPPSSITDMPQIKPILTANLSKSTLHRTMFLSTILIIRKFNCSSLWIRRGDQMLGRWISRPLYFKPWVQKAKLFCYILHLVVNFSSINSTTIKPSIL